MFKYCSLFLYLQVFDKLLQIFDSSFYLYWNRWGILYKQVDYLPDQTYLGTTQIIGPKLGIFFYKIFYFILLTFSVYKIYCDWIVEDANKNFVSTICMFD